MGEECRVCNEFSVKCIIIIISDKWNFLEWMDDVYSNWLLCSVVYIDNPTHLHFIHMKSYILSRWVEGDTDNQWYTK